ncbi:MAG: ABC transporter permease subunit, partial [Planctomycetota bacterium]|nr:ABC transporter permease subunit [Planctomycetota bacterium]
MGRYRRVWVVYRKELIDTLRDRRTLIAMVVAPVLLYPVLMVVIVGALEAEKERREQAHYKVCVPDEVHRAWLEGVLRREDADRAVEAAADREAGRSNGEDAPDDNAGFRPDLSADQVEISIVGPSVSMWDLVVDRTYHVGVLVDPPPDPDDPAVQRNRIVQFIYCDTVPLSEFAYYKLNEAIAGESDRIVQSRLATVPGGARLLEPYLPNSLSTAGPDMQYAKILAAIVPFLLVVMTVTGAMYPAIDLTAGERERGTLETLAVSPAPVGQIVAGKFGVVITLAMFTTVLNLASMTAMIHVTKLDQLVSQQDALGEAAKLAVELEIESAGKTTETAGPTQLDYLEQRRRMQDEARQTVGSLTKAAPLVLAAMIPFAVLFSAIMLAVCSFARTFKEAQNYMMPVMMCAMIPAMVVSYMPSIRLEGALLVVPVANIVVLIRELLLGNQDIAATAVALLSTCMYAGVAVSVAARLYG